MKPIKFDGCNRNWGNGQDEYNTLYGQALNDVQGTNLFCWKLTKWERIKLLFTGKLWHQVLTFNQPLQPQMLSTEKPLTDTQDHGKNK